MNYCHAIVKLFYVDKSHITSCIFLQFIIYIFFIKKREKQYFLNIYLILFFQNAFSYIKLFFMIFIYHNISYDFINRLITSDIV